MTRSSQPPRDTRAATHPAWLRTTHWINALAVGLMLTSGWRIYDAAPLFAFRFPTSLTIGGWLGGALQWHFAAMWLLAGNALVYAVANVLGRRPRPLLGWNLRLLAREVVGLFGGTLPRHEPTRYNAIQQVAYLAALADVLVLIGSGLVLWKSVQFPWLRELLGGYEGARLVHFGAMAALVVFGVVHVAMALAFPRTLLGMVRGRTS